MRLIHQLSLLLLVTVLVVVAAVAGLVVWNLRAGFSDYLRAQDGEQLTRVMQAAESELTERGGPPGAWRPALRRWLDSTRPGPDRPGARPPPEQGRPPPPGPGPGFGQGARPPRPEPDGFGRRLVLLAPDGVSLLAGPPESLELPGQLRAIKLDGQTLALLRLAERTGPAQGVDAGFLRRQYLGLAATALGVLALSLLLARWVAVRWVEPLAQAQAAARRIAAGEFAHRLPATARRGATEIAELHHDINAMAAGLERLESDRRRWIAQLSHELRTPLAVLRGEIEALQDGVRPLQPSAIVSLGEEVERLGRLIEDFHSLALSGLHALPCVFAPVAPLALLQAALERVHARAQAQGLRLESELPAQLPQAQWDAGRVEQLLGNLLENSLRYTQPPGRIRLSARRVGDSIELCLEDSPPGVASAELEQLFEPLYRADASRSRAHGGSGLGLSIARAIAHSHGGSLRAEASPLGGLAMILTLPLCPA